MNTLESLSWPGGKKFALCLTHDVDRVKKTYQYFTHFAKTLRPYHLLSLLQKEEPYWNFEKIMEIEERYGVKSTFFFLNESKKLDLLKPKNWAISLGRYDIHNSKVTNIIKKLHSKGWEIGLHGSYESYRNKELLNKEKEKLEEIIEDEVVGIRQHNLNIEIPKTWKIQYEVGLKYDTTFGFNDKVGFRDSKYLPFHPLDNSFLEIPLTIMDATLFKISRSIDDAWAKCKNLIDSTEKSNGLLTVLWHQEVFNEKEFPGWSKIYEEIIRVCKEKNAWIATCKEIAELWSKDI